MRVCPNPKWDITWRQASGVAARRRAGEDEGAGRAWLQSGQRWLAGAGRKVVAAAKDAQSSLQTRLGDLDVFAPKGTPLGPGQSRACSGASAMRAIGALSIQVHLGVCAPEGAPLLGAHARAPACLSCSVWYGGVGVLASGSGWSGGFKP